MATDVTIYLAPAGGGCRPGEGAGDSGRAEEDSGAGVQSGLAAQPANTQAGTKKRLSEMDIVFPSELSYNDKMS